MSKEFKAKKMVLRSELFSLFMTHLTFRACFYCLSGIILGGDFRDFSQKNHQNLREICEMRENLARQFEPENV
jgi:hypothetical protein